MRYSPLKLVLLSVHPTISISGKTGNYRTCWLPQPSSRCVRPLRAPRIVRAPRLPMRSTRRLGGSVLEKAGGIGGRGRRRTWCRRRRRDVHCGLATEPRRNLSRFTGHTLECLIGNSAQLVLSGSRGVFRRGRNRAFSVAPLRLSARRCAPDNNLEGGSDYVPKHQDPVQFRAASD